MKTFYVTVLSLQLLSQFVCPCYFLHLLDAIFTAIPAKLEMHETLDIVIDTSKVLVGKKPEIMIYILSLLKVLVTELQIYIFYMKNGSHFFCNIKDTKVELNFKKYLEATDFILICFPST